MDAKDCQIIAVLQREGRLSNQDLAERVNLSPSPCLRRVRALEERGIITGYAAVVDEQAYGLPVTAFVRVRLERHNRDAIEEFETRVRLIDQILDCYMLTGSADYLLRVLVASLQDYEAFVRHRLHGIRGIASIDSSFAYGTIKRATVFPRVDP